jgi:hypothetical protein
MAGTVTFNGGSFTGPGTSDTSFTATTTTNTYNVTNNNGSTIVGLGFQADQGVNLIASSRTSLTTDSSSYAFGSGNDSLIIGSSKNSYYTTGDGTNSLRFTFGSTNDIINTGTGVDALTFGGKVNGTLIQLAADNVQDTIKFLNSNVVGTGIKITGADNNDTLFIGSSQYNYDSNQAAWISTTNPNDKKTFNG